MIDQRILPHQVCYLSFKDEAEVANAIREMVIRGAPAIGAAGGYGLALAAKNSQATTRDQFLAELDKAGALLEAARPTAVNLVWAIKRIHTHVESVKADDVGTLKTEALNAANKIAEEDVEINRSIGKQGLAVVHEGAQIIHHCNTGSLATVGHGTALGVIKTAHEHGRHIFVYVDETRPRLQGARLTAWELQQLGIPFRIIADSASGYFMRKGKIDLCLVGCDRVAANGDTANKIGTYNLALAAYSHGIPFYVVGPTSTIDLSLKSGDEIPIENRDPDEITKIEKIQIAPQDALAENPAFDVTPAQYITGIITEHGIANPPYEANLSAICSVL